LHILLVAVPPAKFIPLATLSAVLVVYAMANAASSFATIPVAELRSEMFGKSSEMQQC
jgi:MFS superfamily sulfate permease-like transporter